MLLLAVETTTYEATVALAEGEEVKGVERFPGFTALNKELALRMGKLLKGFGLKPSDLDAVAVSQGPGFFTSLRVGVSAAKALAHALGLKLVAVPTLWIYASSWEGEGTLIVAQPASSRDFFLSVFRRAEGGDEWSELTKAKMVYGPSCVRSLPEDLPLEGKLTIGGPFGGRVEEELGRRGLEAKVDDSLSIPPARGLVKLARALLERGREDSPLSLRPIYLLPSQAERTYGVRVT